MSKQVPNLKFDGDSPKIEMSLREVFTFIKEYGEFCEARTPIVNTRWLPFWLWNLSEILHLYSTTKTLTPKQKEEVETFLKEYLKKVQLLIRMR